MSEFFIPSRFFKKIESFMECKLLNVPLLEIVALFEVSNKTNPGRNRKGTLAPAQP